MVAADVRFSAVVAERTEVVAEVLPYRPGEFYLRELPPIRAVLHGLRGLSLLVVDGYADLDPGSTPGLGVHAHAEFGIPVIGVAKTAFRTATHAVPVLRGTSVRPLFVTAAGMPRDEAADLVRHMAGQHRRPDVVRRADELARTGLPAEERPELPPGAPLAYTRLPIGASARPEVARLRAAQQPDRLAEMRVGIRRRRNLQRDP